MRLLIMALFLGFLLVACSSDSYTATYCTPDDPGLRDAFVAALDLSDDQIPCDQLAELTKLNANAHGIGNLSGIEAAGQLQILSLVGNRVSDLKPLAELDNLTGLDLGGNEVRDLRPLEHLPNLKELYLDANYISDLSPLLNNPGLKDGKALYVRRNCLDLSAESPTWSDVQQLSDNIDDFRYEPSRECKEADGMLGFVSPLSSPTVQALPQLLP